MKEELYQKTGLIVSRLAHELLGNVVHDRIPSISFFEEKYEVSRGTIQNAFTYLKQIGAITLQNRGKLGTYIDAIDYRTLQQYSFKESLMGIMPLPYSKLYEGMASALYEELKDTSLNFNLAYVRGAEARISMVVKGAYDFAVCSLFAANEAIKQHAPIRVLCEFGSYSYLSKHVLVLLDHSVTGLQDGMRVGIDNNSIDQRELTRRLTKEKKNITLVEMSSHQIVSKIKANVIDAGIWNFDEIEERGDKSLNYVELNGDESLGYSNAAIVIMLENTMAAQTLQQYLDKDRIREIQRKVRIGEMVPSY